MTSDCNHAFSVCAYGESPHLPDCINSLKEQSVNTNIVICTATPNEYIKRIASDCEIDLKVRDGSPNISDDWNFAISSAKTRYVTLAHQDDIYERDYVESMLDFTSRSNKPLIFFSDYSELRNGDTVFDTPLLNIKRKMLRKMTDPDNWGSKAIRRRALSLGSPICCPSVTFNLDLLETPIFERGFAGNLDWDAWERISRLDGDFVYCPKRLMKHRIHEESETSKLIRDNIRTKEDLEMFERFWPAPIAYLINAIYSAAQKSN